MKGGVVSQRPVGILGTDLQSRGAERPQKLRESAEFKQIFERVNSPSPAGLQNDSSVAPADRLKFSNHAVERMLQRGISFQPDQIARLQSAVEKAEAKGARDSLVLMDGVAAIVNIKSKTVVTVMDSASLKENVFTNIDSTVVL